MSITIEWEYAGKEYSYGWQDYSGNPGPILPVGSVVNVKVDNQRHVLIISQYRAYYNPSRRSMGIYIKCMCREVE